MEPFNIRITAKSKETTLTMLPIDNEGGFKVIYNGAILGAIKKNDTVWAALADEEVEAGDLPLYKIKFGEENSDIELDQTTVSMIGTEIENVTERVNN